MEKVIIPWIRGGNGYPFVADIIIPISTNASTNASSSNNDEPWVVETSPEMIPSEIPFSPLMSPSSSIPHKKDIGKTFLFASIGFFAVFVFVALQYKLKKKSQKEKETPLLS
jgi:hypothetical protein